VGGPAADAAERRYAPARPGRADGADAMARAPPKGPRASVVRGVAGTDHGGGADRPAPMLTQGTTPDSYLGATYPSGRISQILG